MANETDILNRALGRIGEAPINSINDGSANADWCKTIYPTLRDARIQEHRWRFSLLTVELAQDAICSHPEWTYAYSLPSDFLTLWEYYGATASYAIEGSKLYTDDASVIIRYGRRVDPGSWPPLFAEYVIAYLAYELHGAVKKRTAPALLTEAVEVWLPKAAYADSRLDPTVEGSASDALTRGR